MRNAMGIALVALACGCTVDGGTTGATFTTSDQTGDPTTATATVTVGDTDSDSGGSTGGTSTTGTTGTTDPSTSSTTDPSTSSTTDPSTSSTTGGGAGCGNGMLEMGEECDTNDFGGLTCADFMAGSEPFDTGTLQCGVNCTILTTNCSVCGDDTVSGIEVCDGTDLGAATCATEGFDGGTLACSGTCDALDTAGCTVCGDGNLDAGETCDTDVGAETCANQGFDGGALACGADCGYDTTGCYTCGDNMASGPEDCDGNDLAGTSCTDLPAPQNGNFTGGTLGCDNACAFDTSGCTWCGDGVKNGVEDCDTNDLGTGMCGDLGYLGGGTLGCNADCTYDDAACVGPICGVVEPGQGACPAQCDNCNNGVCTFVCDSDIFDNGKCINQVLDCPAGWPCHADCNQYGCQGTTLNCADGVCTVDCDGIKACPNMNVNCDVQSCSATCDIFTEPTMNCGSSCDCQPC